MPSLTRVSRAAHKVPRYLAKRTRVPIVEVSILCLDETYAVQVRFDAPVPPDLPMVYHGVPLVYRHHVIGG